MFKSAPIIVGAEIAEGGKELMDEIPVRAVNFGYLETGFGRAAGGGPKRIDDRADLGDGQLARRGVAKVEWNGAGRDGLPSSGFLRNHAAALPWRGRAALAAGVRKLNAGGGAMRGQKASDARERLDVLVPPDAGIAGRYATTPFHRGRFHENQASAAPIGRE